MTFKCFLQRTTANASTRGSRRPKRRVLCVNSASLRKTQSTLTQNLKRRAERMLKKRGPMGKDSPSAHPSFGPLVPTPHQGPLGPTPPSRLLAPSVWSPQYPATHLSRAMESTKTTTQHRRTRTQRAMTQEKRGTTPMTTLHSLFAGVEWLLTILTALFSFTCIQIYCHHTTFRRLSDLVLIRLVTEHLTQILKQLLWSF